MTHKLMMHTVSVSLMPIKYNDMRTDVLAYLKYLRQRVMLITIDKDHLRGYT